MDIDSITRVGDIATNYQVLPGDRIYIAEDKLVALDSNLQKLIAPAERIIGFSLLGVGMRDLFGIGTVNLSVAVWVGFIALFGIASDDGVFSIVKGQVPQALSALEDLVGRGMKVDL